MKTKLPWLVTILLGVALVVVAFARPVATPAPAPAKHPLYYVDPMHPAYRSDKPGKAPDCGMDLVPVFEETAAASKLTITPQRQQLIGVQSAPAELRAIGRSIRTVGRVTVDETRLHTITTKFDGYIEKLYVNYTGREIARGEPLFTIYSPDLLATQQEYLLALRAAKQSPLLLDAARRRLELWDIGAAGIRDLERSGAARKSLTISSPTHGFVMTKNVVEGARVTAGQPLFELADLDHLWIVADVYESELAWVRVGAQATMTLSYLPGRTFTGKVTFIAPTIDPLTRTAKVRIEADNRDGALKPEMFADVTLQEAARNAIVIPESAVIATGTRNIVYVVNPDNTFEQREVETGTKNDDFIEIRGGIAAGERVATQANFLIDSEARLKPSEGRGQKAEAEGRK